MTPKDETLGDFTTTWRMIPVAALAILIGGVSSLVALALLRTIALFTNIFYFQRWSFEASSPAQSHLGPFVVIVPVVGALIIGVMARYGSEKIRGHGIPEAIEAILLRGSRVQLRVAFLKPLSSAISIGSGGPFGAEGPIIMTCCAIGSIVAQWFQLTAAERKTLLVAGAAGGMSATFDAPIAATMLAVELILFEWKPRSFVPVALAAATAAIARPYLLGTGPIFPLPMHVERVTPVAYLACAMAGILAGLLSAGLTKAVYLAEDFFHRLPIHWMWWPAIGGLAIGICGLVEPRALGVGYDVIESLLRGGLGIRFLLVLVLVKGLIWSFSLGSGTSGGVLAPLLMMGAALGGLEAHIFPSLGGGFLPLISTAAILGGTMRSPFTGVIFALELTHEVDMLLPLLIAVAVAHGFTVLLLRRSILTEKMVRRGFHLSREYAIDPLEILFVRDVMATKVVVLPATTSREVVAQSLAGKERFFAVTGRSGRLVGVVSRRDLQTWVAMPPGESDSGSSLARVARMAVTARADEPLRVVVHRMAETGRTQLPVVDREDPKKLLGWITLRDMLKARVRHLEEEQRQEGPLPIRIVLPRWLSRASVAPPAPDSETRVGR
ncbi:chloride channel protein [soil metagenome]